MRCIGSGGVGVRKDEHGRSSPAPLASPTSISIYRAVGCQRRDLKEESGLSSPMITLSPVTELKLSSAGTM